MSKSTDNLSLVLYDSTQDKDKYSNVWFDETFGYTDSNMTKIDDAYKNLNDSINDKPSKTGDGASGTWDINISGNAGYATTCSTAVSDQNYNNIASTYIKDISIISGNIRYTTGDDKDTTIGGLTTFINGLPSSSTTSNDNDYYVGQYANGAAHRKPMSSLWNYIKSKADSVYNKYELPVATSSTLGGVKQGSNLTIDSDGAINMYSYNIQDALGYKPTKITYGTDDLTAGGSLLDTGTIYIKY
jgi:hypothetical protein